MFWVGLSVCFQVPFCLGVCAVRLCGAIFALCCEGEGDFLDVLGCGRASALLFEMQEAPEAGMTVTVTPFDICKGSLNSVPSAFINGLAPIDPADLAFFRDGLARFVFKRLFAVIGPVWLDRSIQVIPIIRPRLLNGLLSNRVLLALALRCGLSV